MYASLVTKIQDVIRTRYKAPQNNTGSVDRFTSHLSVFAFQQTRAISSVFPAVNATDEQACSSMVCFAPKHFLHNTMMSILVLPTSPVFDDFRHTVKGDNNIWRANWQGNFTPSALLFLILNIFFIVLGIGAAWKYQGLPGLVPLAIFVIYNLANAFARTSGGRYIVPADWIIPLYFMIGLLFSFWQIANLILRQPLLFFDGPSMASLKASRAWSPWITTLAVFIALFGFGSLVPLSEKVHLSRYANIDSSTILQEHQAQVTDAGFDLEEINTFLKSPGAEVLVGRVLYPRSFKLGQGIVSFYFYPFTTMNFPRTGFFLIGPKGQDNILLPGSVPKYLPHASDALVIGCREQNYVDALLVVELDTDAAYARRPKSELTCPLRQPVCENNTVCQ
jgi:hypothetical protein